jgi:hypothetical protein
MSRHMTQAVKDEYTIVPGNQSKEYTWEVKEGVQLIIKMMKGY